MEILIRTIGAGGFVQILIRTMRGRGLCPLNPHKGLRPLTPSGGRIPPNPP